MDYETALAIGFVGLFVYFSLDFKKHYASQFHDTARNPFARFLAGVCVVVLSSTNPILAMIALSIVFFWIADVHLLSTIVL